MLKSATSPSGLSRATSRATLPVGRRVPAWLREPLLHFVVLGALLFAMDRVAFEKTDDPRVIVVGAEVDTEARQVFNASRGRMPTDDELAALRRVWLDNEVLYREGLALGVDKGDTAIRERIIFKALTVVDSGVALPPVDDRMLRDWFQTRHDRYDEPARFDFDEAVLSGATTESAVRAFADTLNRGIAGDTGAGLRVFKDRPRANLVESYGPEFARALDEAGTDVWMPLPAKGGWRAIRLDARRAAKPAVFESLRNVVQQDWVDATLSEQRSAAVRALAAKYRVRMEATKP